MWKRLFVVVLLAALIARAEEPAREVPPQDIGGIADAKDAGAISGVVLFKGEKPEQKPIAEIAGNAFCKEHHKDKLPVKDTFLFGKNTEKNQETLQNVLVYVSKGLEGQEFEPPPRKVVLDQVGCMYTPHVVAVMVGQPLEVRNSDATLHNVMSTPRDNAAFNFGMAVKGETRKLEFKYPEMKMNTKCFMHPWMSGYIHVLEHPFFAVTGEDGTFKIEGLPPGEYEISVLHESSLVQPTTATATITVAAGETKKNVEFTYEVKKEE
ncbi:MAG TPA: carboxypeptidase regulatory-like domain-containing protein [Tepidisphaeraceae bacterium]|nr:carboxypeptidase regulatory-like domain-containing protein [Tepidisphaeraceae bacterium]